MEIVEAIILVFCLVGMGCVAYETEHEALRGDNCKPGWLDYHQFKKRFYHEDLWAVGYVLFLWPLYYARLILKGALHAHFVRVQKRYPTK